MKFPYKFNRSNNTLASTLRSKGHNTLASKVELTLSSSDTETEKNSKEFISFLKGIQKNIPKAIKEIEKDEIGLTTSSLVGKMIGIPKGEDWYNYYFG